jgi:hypothetical protein
MVSVGSLAQRTANEFFGILPDNYRYPITVVTAEGNLTESEWTSQVLGRTVVKVSQRCRISAGAAP